MYYKSTIKVSKPYITKNKIIVTIQFFLTQGETTYCYKEPRSEGELLQRLAVVWDFLTKVEAVNKIQMLDKSVQISLVTTQSCNI